MIDCYYKKKMLLSFIVGGINGMFMEFIRNSPNSYTTLFNKTLGLYWFTNIAEDPENV